jgi:drug/metabolite transporter (DMT)-like permease
MSVENCIGTSSRIGAPRAAILWGALGVLAFSLTLPATRLAVSELDPTLVGLGRALVAAGAAGVMLVATRQRLPLPRHWPRLAVTALGIIFGFPLFSAWALVRVPAAHGAVIVGLLPAATAAMAALRSGERPSPAFCLAALLGLGAILGFALAEGAGRPQPADGLILIAVLLGGLGYAEGGALARELGGWQVISWVLVLSAPLLLPVVLWRAEATGLSANLPVWVAFAYVSVVSTYIGFFAWYRAMALGGVARIGQLQLAQPVLTLLWSALLLGERVTAGMALAAAAVLAAVALTQRAPVARPRTP